MELDMLVPNLNMICSAGFTLLPDDITYLGLLRSQTLKLTHLTPYITSLHSMSRKQSTVLKNYKSR